MSAGSAATTGSSDPVAAFQDAMARFGIVSKHPIRANGRLNRFDVEGDSRGSKNGYYTLHLDGRPAGRPACLAAGSVGSRRPGRPMARR